MLKSNRQNLNKMPINLTIMHILDKHLELALYNLVPVTVTSI